jgi:5-bromo-4-chloroindolyl phosphate hydrolysis protein
MLYNKTLIAFKCNKSVQTSNELVNCNKYFYSNKRPNRWWKQHDFFFYVDEFLDVDMMDEVLETLFNDNI